jgi:glutamate racemase
VLSELIKVMPNEDYIYFGDNKNAPYGCKTERQLLELMIENITSVLRFGVKAVVIACNTISTTIFHKLSYYFPDLKFFGIFPPVEINLLHKRKTLLLCTFNTSKMYKNGEFLTVLPLNDLAKEIENNMNNLENVNVSKNLIDASLVWTRGENKDHILSERQLKMIIDHRLHYFDVVILGCTHYFFVSKKIFDHFRPQVILGGEKFTARRVKLSLNKLNSIKNISKNQLIFFGETAEYNFQFFNKNFPKCEILKKIVKNI